MSEHRKQEKKEKATSSTDHEVQDDSNNVDNIFHPIILARFCVSFAERLDHGLTKEELTCLHKECTEVACHFYDIHLKIQLINLSFSKYILCDDRLEEFFIYMSFNLNDSEKRILPYKKRVDAAKTARDKQDEEMVAYFNLGALNKGLHQYYDVVVYFKKCLAIAREIDDKRFAMTSCLMLGKAYRDLKLDSEAIAYCNSCVSIAKEVDDISTEMTACFIVGKLHFSHSNYKEALLYSERSLENAKELGDERYEAMVYLLIQDCQHNLGNYHDAILAGQKCIATSKEIGDLIAAYEILGRSYWSLNHLEKAIDCFNETMAIAKKSGDVNLEMDSYFSVGKFYYSQYNQLEEAVVCMKNCLEIAVNIGNRERELYAYMALGDSYLRLEQHENALHYIQKCLDIAKKSGNAHAEGDAHVVLGKTFDALHQEVNAISHFKKGIDIFKEIGEEKHEMEDHFLLGRVYRSCNNYDEAIESFKKALIIAWKIRDKNMQKEVYFLIGNIYEFMNQYDKAVCYAKKYLEVGKEMGSEDDVMEAYLALGVAYLGLDNYEHTFLNLNEGLKIATEREDTSKVEGFDKCLKDLHLRIEELGKATNFAGFISCGSPCLALLTDSEQEHSDAFLEKYICHRSSNDYEQAIACLKRQLNLFERCVHYHGTDKVYCLLEMADIYDTLGQYQNSLQCYQEALAIASRVDAKHLQAITHFRQGLTYMRLHWMKEAEKSFREAIRNFETMFNAVGGEDFKISLLDAYVNCFKYLARVLVHTKQVEQALVVSDRARARSLNGLLQKYGMNGEINEVDLEYKEIKSLVSENRCSTFFYTLVGPMLYVFILDNERELQFSIKRFGCSCTDEITFDMLFDEALEEMDLWDPDDDDYEDYRSLGKPPCKAAVRRKKTDARKLSKKCQKSYLSKETRSSRGDDKPQKCEDTTKGSALERLSSMLLKYETLYSINQDGTSTETKNVQYLGQEDEILIIPDGHLYKVPFNALRDPETGQYLSETKRIRLVPSFATLKALQQSSAYHDINEKGALIVGVPSVGKVMSDGKEAVFGELENVFPEVLGVGNLLHEKYLFGEEATKAAVIQRLKQGAAIVHIAAHGSLAKGTIILSPPPEVRATKIPDEEDYMLTMAEVQQTQVRAQLVVLSCCYTGRGEIRAEGVVSMCRAFLASGARAVVASLWKVDDEAAADFMFKFYVHLVDGKSAGASLQQAMKEMRRISSYSKPKYWAPFFLVGDDVTISVKG